MRKWNLSLILSSLSFIAALIAIYAVYFMKPRIEDPFAKRVFTHIRSCIEFNKDLPGKEDILALIQQIQTQYSIVESGNDTIPSKFVFTQGCFEHVLACAQALGEINQLVAVFHTPSIAMPFCVKSENPGEDILDSSIRHDLNKLLTLRTRAQIVREYLIKGGKLYVVYPQGGEHLRTSSQREVYSKELKKFAGRLIDWPLTTKSIDPDMIGATYLFRNAERQVFAFAIKSRQAIDIQSKAEWGLWFGPINDSLIQNRVNLIMDYLAKRGGPDIRNEII